MNKLTYNSAKRILAAILAAAAVSTALVSCVKDDDTPNKGDDISVSEKVDSGADNEIELPENENKKEEIIINDNYADSELFDFEGTIDEIYEDGSMLVYSPYFGVNFDYKVIVELDENTEPFDFEPKINQQLKFNVYSAVKKSEPLTVVAADAALVKEVSTQREEEEARKQRVEENLKKYLEGEGQ